MKSILIVEDEKVIAASIKNILRHLGYKDNYIAASGSKAIKIIEEKHPDLVLADIVLEGEINGIELAKQVKSEYRLPVIFLTSYSDEKTVSDAKLSEPYGFITKPFKIEELKITLEIAFHKFKMERRLIESEEELRKAYVLLEETQQELIQSKTLANLGEFAAGIAHEIRNPLANISALAQYSMKKFDLEKKMIKNLEAIMKSSQRANNIIKELLDFAKPHTLEFEYVCIADVINKVCDLTEAKRLNHQVECNKRCSANLPKIMVDEKLLEQALINIIMNSLDAMPKGGRLTVTALQNEDFIVIKISDTGKGIAQKDIDKIFNPFFTLKQDGVGLGLSVTHRIIQSHRGKIEVESIYNKGTKFTIKLPIVHKEK